MQENANLQLKAEILAKENLLLRGNIESKAEAYANSWFKEYEKKKDAIIESYQYSVC